MSYPRLVLTHNRPPSPAKTIAAVMVFVVAAAVGLVLLLRWATGPETVGAAGAPPPGPASAAADDEGGAPPAESASKPTAEIRKWERYIAGLINEERERRGVPKLRLSSRLSKVARAHSEDMRDKRYFSHESPTRGYRTSEDRYFHEYSGWYHRLGENIARREGPAPGLTEANLRKTHEGLMHSPRHRENIMRPQYEIVGIGIASDGAGAYWLTEMFLDPWRASDGRQPPPPERADPGADS